MISHRWEKSFLLVVLVVLNKQQNGLERGPQVFSYFVFGETILLIFLYEPWPHPLKNSEHTQLLKLLKCFYSVVSYENPSFPSYIQLRSQPCLWGPPWKLCTWSSCKSSPGLLSSNLVSIGDLTPGLSMFSKNCRAVIESISMKGSRFLMYEIGLMLAGCTPEIIQTPWFQRWKSRVLSAWSLGGSAQVAK